MDHHEIREYYASGIEKHRLDQNYFKLEGIRTKEIISRYLTVPGLNILDVGGGAGYYAFWLQSLGHHVSLIDLSPDNINLVRQYELNHGVSLKFSAEGDARKLDFPDDSFDLVLMLGPLYHLIDRTERIQALAEARRVLKPNGLVIAAIISRYASLIDGLRFNLIADEKFVEILSRDLETGIHLNVTDNPQYFTTSYFHTMSEIEEEIKASRLEFQKLIAVEGVGWLSDDYPKGSEIKMDVVLDMITRIESNKDLISASPHILAIANK